MHKAIKILILASIFFNLSVGLFGPIYAIFVEKIRGGILSASAAIALYNILFGVLKIFFGRLEDIHFDKRKMITLGYLLNALGFAGYALVQNPLQLFLIQIALGTGDAIKNPAWEAIFSKSLDRGRESSEWAYWGGSTAIIYGIASIIGGNIAMFFGFRTLFVIMAIITLISAIISSLLFRKKILIGFFKI
jgi:MFS family permease